MRQEKVNYDIYQLTSLYEKVTDPAAETHSDILAFEVIKASSELAERLNLLEGALVYYVKRVRFIRQIAVTLEETWMPLALFPDLSYAVMQGSKYHYIEEVKQLVIDRSEQEIIPVLPLGAGGGGARYRPCQAHYREGLPWLFARWHRVRVQSQLLQER